MTQDNPHALFIGLDLGTSGCRAIAIDHAGLIKAHSSLQYPNVNQQTPEIWWQTSQAVLQKLLSKIEPTHVQAIAVDGTSGTVLLCDDNGAVLTPALMYNDPRAKQQAINLQQYVPNDSCVLSASSGLAKALWLFENHDLKNNFHLIHQADWIAGKLCQRFDFSDVNNALKTGYDPINNQWPEWLRKLFNSLNIPLSCLPKIYSPGEIVSKISSQTAKCFSLSADVKVIAGTTDSTAAFIATGATRLGQAVTSLGSTLVLKVISDVEINSPEHGVYSQPFGKHWLVGGASNSGGAVLRHYFTDEKMFELSKKIQAHVNTGLNYYPLLTKGERFPHNDENFAPQLEPRAKDETEFFQALLEGMTEIEHSGYQLLQQLGAPKLTSLQTSGGGSVNIAWQEMRANKLKIPVTVATQTDAAYGAALLARQNGFN